MFVPNKVAGAAVIGGTSLFGGRGRIVNAVLDALAREAGVQHLEYRNLEERHTEWPRQELYVTFRKEILPDEEANTIAGLVIHEARMIPDVGQAFVFHGFRFEILKKRRHQITALRMAPVKRDGEAEAA